MQRSRIVIVLGIIAFGVPLQAQGPKVPGDPVHFYETQVKPILQSQCLRCHGGEAKIKGGLNFLTRAGLLKGGESGPAINLDKPGTSLLLEAVHYTNDELKMPPKGKLPKAQIDILTQWVQMGAPYGKVETVKKGHGVPQVDAEAKNFWSFKPVARPKVPEVKNKDWVKSPIDAFLLAKLEAAGLSPAPPADRLALARRLYYDLTGLPPTPRQVDEFLKDKAPDAYEKLVDRLLESPHYGEHFARHWLDLVRYAETNSYERDGAKPFVWRYRDYVIRSFNADKPYDRFLTEQLAGDELDTVTPDSFIATAYLRLGVWDDEPVDPVLANYDDLDDIVMTTSHAMLGLTVNCCRCHDHKIDPIPQKDYYRFLAFFHGIRRYGVRSPESVAEASLRPIPGIKETSPKEMEEYKRKLDGVIKKLTAIEDEVHPKLGGGERDDFKYETNKVMILKKHVGKLLTAEQLKTYLALRKERTGLEKNPPGAETALVVTEWPKAPDTFILARGNPGAKGDKVTPGFPSVLTDEEPLIREGMGTSGRRRALAEWITNPKNPLTYRVLVNRVWQWHFGRGIVRSSSNFGYQGTPPTHPELLDWLAGAFVENGKSIKKLNRMILLSNAYRMSSQGNKEALTKDPENDLFWRYNMRRLRAEEVRDSILAASGNLNVKKMYGPSIYPHIPKEVLAGQSQPGAGWGKSPPEEAARRSIYIHIKRSLAVPILQAFDVPDTDSTCPVRFTTTQPTQALGMLNGEFLNEQAGIFAANVKKSAASGVEDQVRIALERVFQREPNAKEVERGTRFVNGMRTEYGLSADESLRRFCLLALNLNEFMFLD